MIQALWATFFATAAGYALGRNRWLRGVWLAIKPIPALCLAVVVGQHSLAYAAAFGLYALGDALLLDKTRYFVPGLAAFLVGHLVLIPAVLTEFHLGVAPGGIAAGAALGAGMLVLLWPGLSASKRVAVPVYTLSLVALLAAFTPLGPAGALGAGLFLGSDALLGYQAFRNKVPYGDLGVSLTYYSALGLFAYALTAATSSS